VAERFWAKVDKTSRCWLWTGGHDIKGYGRFRPVSTGPQRQATHVAWELTYGTPVTEGHFLCHRCDNPPCVRPAHLYVGTRLDNAADWVARGENAMQTHPELVLRGTMAWNVKMTDETVRQMRALWSVGGITTYQLAERFGVSQRTAYKVVSHKGWTHVT